MDFTSILLIRHLTDISDINNCIETIFLRTYKFIHIRRFNGAVSEEHLFYNICNYIDSYTKLGMYYGSNAECQRKWDCEKPFIRESNNENTILVGYESVQFIAIDYNHNKYNPNVIYKKYLSIDDIITEYYEIVSHVNHNKISLSDIMYETTKYGQTMEYIMTNNDYDEGEHYIIAFVLDTNEDTSCFTSDEEM